MKKTVIFDLDGTLAIIDKRRIKAGSPSGKTPTPVPIITPKTEVNPCPEPRFASAIAKQFASFSIEIFWSSLLSKSFFKLLPIIQLVLL